MSASRSARRDNDVGVICAGCPLTRDFDSAGGARRPSSFERDAAQRPHSLDDRDAAVIETDSADAACLTPGRDTIARDSVANPYSDLTVVRQFDTTAA